MTDTIQTDPKPSEVDPIRVLIDNNYNPDNDPYKATHYPPPKGKTQRFPISGKSGGRPKGLRTDKVKQNKLQLMLAVTAEHMSKDPLPTNADGLPSFDKVLQEYVNTEEGRQLIRMAARALVVKASSGDNPAMFELAKRLDGQAKIKNEIIAKVDRTSEQMSQFTPQELEEFIRNANNLEQRTLSIAPEKVEYLTHQEPKQPTYHELREARLKREREKETDELEQVEMDE